MVKLITGYHGTNDLKGILKSGAILPKYQLQKGIAYWEERKREYDSMTRDFAERFREEMINAEFQNEVEKKWLYDGSARLVHVFPNLLEREDFLANCFSEKLFRSPESKRYSELLLGLTVCLGYNLKYAAPYEGSDCKNKTPAVLKLTFPTELLRPSTYAVMEVMGGLDLKYFVEAHASLENLESVKNLILSRDFGHIAVNELGINNS